jgi:DNA-directed RNA polymerase specialized sigma24 family protein
MPIRTRGSSSPRLYDRLAVLDAALVERAAGGDRAAFDRIFDVLFPVVWALAVDAVGLSQRDAELLTGRVLERVVLGLGSYKPQIPFGDWLRGAIEDELRVGTRARAEKRPVTAQRAPTQPQR